MTTHANGDLRIAILIDADNISEKYIGIVLDEVANVGVATYKRIYGDWTSPRLASWKNCLLDNSIIPMQQYSYTFGKNATDSAMIIDAMDILYSGTVDGFAIVSSDSDFTRLVARLRESGMQVMGMGEQKTPQPFISACNQFKYLDLLLAARRAEEETDAEPNEAQTPQKRGRGRKKAAATQEVSDAAGSSPTQAAPASDGAPKPSRRHPGDAGGASSAEQAPEEGEVRFGEMDRADRRRHLKRIRENVNSVLDQFSDDDGWMSLGKLGDQLAKRLPDFDVRNYGFKKLSPFLRSLGAYEFDEPTDASGHRQIYLRLREN